MAEAIVSLSVAANIIQFVDFAARITDKFYKFYQSDSGVVDDGPDLKTINSDLLAVLEELQKTTSTTKTSSPGLAKLAQECEKTADQLNKLILPLLKARFQNLGKRAALKAAFQAIWRENEIESLQEKLNSFRSQLTLHLLVSLRQIAYQNVANQNEIIEKLRAMSQDQQSSHRLQPVDPGLAIPLLHFLTSKLNSIATRKKVEARLRMDLLGAIRDSELDQSRPSIAPSVEISREKELKDRVLASLYYSGMGDREGRITEAYESTFQWIFEDSPHLERKWNNFKDWLLSDARLYWITGKAGSGKSTLVKYICENRTPEQQFHCRCLPFLSQWADGKRLIMARFFFWNSGINLQMTQAGLFRTLLYQILKQDSRLIPYVCPRRWEVLHLFNDDPLDWTHQELSQMTRTVVEHLHDDSKLCLFIDGLDEFDGDHKNLVRLFSDLAKHPRIKLCVASRPWVEFEDAFKHRPSLMLQDLTYPDIKFYVASSLEKDEGFELLRKREPTYASDLVESIVSKSSGVFLWVSLVVASILTGMVCGDRISDLQRRIDALPSELEELYEKMLSSLDPFYLEHAAQLFKFVQISEAPPSLFTMACADSDGCFKSAMTNNLQPLTSEYVDIQHETMRRRVNSRCKGFLEVGQVVDPELRNGFLAYSLTDKNYSVQYLHRTVRDYMESSGVQQRLRQAMKSPYDACLRHCISILSVLKARLRRPQIIPVDLLRQETRSFMQYAKGTKSESQEQLRDLIDELDATVTTYCVNTYLDLEMHDAVFDRVFPTPNDGPSNAHILSIAVRCGLLGYVSGSTNDPDCVVSVRQFILRERYYCNDNKDIYPLLLDAVSARGETPLESEPNIEMVAFLLKHGADPNTVVASDSGKSFTVWQAALAAPLIKEENTGHQVIDAWKTWLDVYELFLDHGAGGFKEEIRSKWRSEFTALKNRGLISKYHWDILVLCLNGGLKLPRIYNPPDYWYPVPFLPQSPNEAEN